MRDITISEGEFYHVYNRGMAKQDIFYSDRDYSRFLFSLLYFQSPISFEKPQFYNDNFEQHGFFDRGTVTSRVVAARSVELISFCLMPNHFHILVYEKVAGGISRYMQRVQNGYTKYVNIKYRKSGHLFQGPYKVVHVENNEQLLHLSAYIHKNPIEMPISQKTSGKTSGHRVSGSFERHNRGGRFYEQFEWSSCQDYLGNNRWGDLIVRDAVLEQFDSAKEYGLFMKSSTAKENIYI